MAAGGSTRTVVAALIANGCIAIAKFVGFLITGASSMLTESVHSFADTSNQFLLLLGGRRARRAASREHPFGYGRERYFWSFVVAMILFSLGGLFAIYEGWEKIHHPHELDNAIVAIVILVFAAILESYAFKTAANEANRVRGTLSWIRFIRRSRNPELPVVLLEDSGALLGILIALGGVVMSLYVDPVWDGYATFAIGILLLVIAVILAIEMKSLLIGESAVPEDRDRLIAAIEGQPMVTSLLHLRTQHLGPDELLVGAKVNFRSSMTSGELVRAINQTEASIRDAVPIARVIYIEPDIAGTPSVTLGTLEPPDPHAHDHDDHSDDDDDHDDDGHGHDDDGDGHDDSTANDDQEVDDSEDGLDPFTSERDPDLPAPPAPKASGLTGAAGLAGAGAVAGAAGSGLVERARTHPPLGDMPDTVGTESLDPNTNDTDTDTNSKDEEE